MIFLIQRHCLRAALAVFLPSVFVLLFQSSLLMHRRALGEFGANGGNRIYEEIATSMSNKTTNNSDSIVEFWRVLLVVMMDAKPKPGKAAKKNAADSNLFNSNQSRIDKTPEDDLRDAIKASQLEFRSAASSLAYFLPYAGKVGHVDEKNSRQSGKHIKPRGRRETARNAQTATDNEMPTSTRRLSRSDVTPTRGIVMTVGGSFIGVAVVSLLMLRRSGSRLLVQLFLDDDNNNEKKLCETVLPALGAECYNLQRFWETTPSMPRLSKFQFRAFSILFSSYREILFLDVDCWPIHSPDDLFESEPFASRGLVAWPGSWLPTASPALYDILGVSGPPLTERRSSVSGILLYDKARHSTGLLLAVFYNFYGPEYYYHLFSQSAAGQGNMGTYLHGAIVAGERFYSVQTPAKVLGRSINGTYTSAAVRQADPREDLRVCEASQGAETEFTFDLSKNATTTTGLSQKGTRKRNNTDTGSARWMFVHQNLVKINVQRLDQSMKDIYAIDERGVPSRLWDVEKEFNEKAGYDVERAMWDEVYNAACSEPPTTKACKDFQKYYAAVFD